MNKDHYAAWCEASRQAGPYKMQEPEKGELMSVAELGKVLGLKKTDRYWLVHKGLFETTTFLGKMWIRRDSFEKWYAGQVKYRKVDSEEPGSKLREGSYSVRDIAGMLRLHESTVYELIKREGIETITVNGWMRVPRDAFDRWYSRQGRYRTQEDLERDAAAEADSFSYPEAAALLGITRGHLYRILKDPRYKDYFKTVMIAGKKRITKESFYRFLDGQDKYYLKAASKDPGEGPAGERDCRLSNFRQKKLLEGGSARDLGTADYLTVEEAALVAGVSRTTVNSWIRKGFLSTRNVGRATWISRKELENRAGKQRRVQKGGSEDGNHT